MAQGRAAHRLGRELDRHVGPGGEAGVDLGEGARVGDGERQVVQADAALPIEGPRRARILGLPEREHDVTVAHEDRGVVGLPADFLEAQGVEEEIGSGAAVGHGETDVVRALGKGCHGVFLVLMIGPPVFAATRAAFLRPRAAIPAVSAMRAFRSATACRRPRRSVSAGTAWVVAIMAPWFEAAPLGGDGV